MNSMAKVLDGKTALVTGASRGIGRAIAQKLADSGALVAINYAANETAAHEALQSINAKGGKGFLLKGELGTPGSAEKLATALEAQLTRLTGEPGLDILVNNVGGGVGGGFNVAFDTITPEFFDATVLYTMSAPFWVTKALKPRLRRGGRVVNIGSVAARIALKEVCVYSMSKAAVNTFTVMMAKEFAPNEITVNCVVPGMTYTDRTGKELDNPEIRKYFDQNTLMGRVGEPDEIASVVRDLVTPAWGWVTGQIIEASGGYRL
jgi:3-oxoacyl-[acyl-carrier protein] reductase